MQIIYWVWKVFKCDSKIQGFKDSTIQRCLWRGRLVRASEPPGWSRSYNDRNRPATGMDSPSRARDLPLKGP